MSPPGPVFGIPAILVLILGFAAQQPKDITDDPKYLKPVDLGQCNLKVMEIERVASVQPSKGDKLVPSRKDAQLVLLHPKGVSPEIGRVSLNAHSFGIHYI